MAEHGVYKIASTSLIPETKATIERNLGNKMSPAQKAVWVEAMHQIIRLQPRGNI